MAKIEKFEDLEIWQKARQLANDIFVVFLSNLNNRDFALKDQINRSSGSVMDNIAEGFNRGGNKEFIQYLYISKASLGEVQSQLYRISDRKYISEKEVLELQQKAETLINQIGKFTSYLNKSDMKGEKYHNRTNKIPSP